MKYLDSTLDIVFKLLLLSSPELLRDMIEAVINPSTPIESVEALNPEIPKNFPSNKGIVLDLRLRLRNGHQIDLEMQSTVPGGVHARFGQSTSAWHPLIDGLSLNGGLAF
ncbi:MAG TPA: PD-(D/E)XK nuclease family transposase [Polyangiaceae bacterium]